MIDRPTTQISLRRFRETIADLRDPVEVSRRDADGNITVLGSWTPYAIRKTEAPNLDLELDLAPKPKVIRSTAEVATIVAPHPVRSVPKPSQRKR